MVAGGTFAHGLPFLTSTCTLFPRWRQHSSSLQMTSNIAVFGGSGLTGAEVVYQALERGCKVTAFCRSASKLAVRRQLTPSGILHVSESLSMILGAAFNVHLPGTVRSASSAVHRSPWHPARGACHGQPSRVAKRQPSCTIQPHAS